MARRKRVYNKEVRKDSRYDSELVAALISNIMLDGKKVARRAHRLYRH
jgi:small subunit ribosomal protein S7